MHLSAFTERITKAFQRNAAALPSVSRNVSEYTSPFVYRRDCGARKIRSESRKLCFGKASENQPTVRPCDAKKLIQHREQYGSADICNRNICPPVSCRFRRPSNKQRSQTIQ